MSAFLGRGVEVQLNGERISLRTKGLSFQNEALDLTGGEANGYRLLHRLPVSRGCTVACQGIVGRLNAATLMQRALDADPVPIDVLLPLGTLSAALGARVTGVQVNATHAEAVDITFNLELLGEFTWTPFVEPPDPPLPTHFVVVGNGPRSMHSVDAQTYTNVNHGFDKNWKAVCFSFFWEKFIAVSNDNGAMRSLDYTGTSFELATTSQIGKWNSVAENPITGRLLAVAGDNMPTSGKIMYSDDGGDTWAYMPGAPSSHVSFAGIKYIPWLSAWLLGNTQAVDGKSNVFISFDDGESWAQPEIAAPSAHIFNGFAYSADRVCSADATGGGMRRQMITEDGSAWDLVDTGGFGDANAVVHGGDVFITVGAGGGTDGNGRRSDDNGVSFAALFASTPNYTFIAAAYGVTLDTFAVVRIDGLDRAHDAVYSTDGGLTWHDATTPDGTGVVSLWLGIACTQQEIF